MDIITGEKFQYLCDIHLGITEFNPKSHIFNPTIDKSKCYVIDTLHSNNDFDFTNVKRVFIHTHCLNQAQYFNKALEILKKINHNFILIFHNSDDPINNKHLKFLNETKCTKILGQNAIVQHKDVICLPIGIANSKWPHGNLNILTKVIKEQNPKKNEIFFNFNIGTNKEKRTDCHNKLKNKLKFITKIGDHYTYLKRLAAAKYCICPQGNGIDTHRFWECLYLKVVPICLRSPFTENFAKKVPILLINDWNNLVIDNDLYNNYDKYNWNIDEYLTFNYWKKLIESF